MKALIVISGTPGTGKSSVARVLKRGGWNVLELKELAKKNRIITGYDIKDRSMIIEEGKISEAIEKELKGLGEGNYILASHLGHFVSPKIVKLCIILRCNPLELEKRLKKRGYDKIKTADNVMCEFLDACLIEAIETGHKKHLHEIDTTKKSPASAAKEIIDVLKGTKKKSYGKISWIQK